MKKTMISALLALSLTVAAVPAFAADVTGASSWNVAVGKGLNDGASLESMFPNVIVVHEGDPVTFTNQTSKGTHTVTFSAGKAAPDSNDPAVLKATSPSGVKWDGTSLLSSGELAPGDSYEIIFTSVGTYTYYSANNPSMMGMVVVMPAGTPIANGEVQSSFAKKLTSSLSDKALYLRQNAQRFNSSYKNEGGTVTYRAELGLGGSDLAMNKIYPGTLFVSAGDSVEWTNESPYLPHYVLFNKPEGDDFLTADGSVEARFANASPSSSLVGTSLISSGPLQPGAKYKLSFPTAGTYNYEVNNGNGIAMNGKVVVYPKEGIKVIVNNNPLLYGEDYLLPFFRNDTLYVPIVPYIQSLGGQAVWDEAAQTAYISTKEDVGAPGTLVSIDGAAKVVANGKQLLYKNPAKPIEIDGHIYAPAEELAKAFGGYYSWDERNHSSTVYIPN